MKLTNDKGIALIYYVIIVVSIIIVTVSAVVIYSNTVGKEVGSMNKELAKNVNDVPDKSADNGLNINPIEYEDFDSLEFTFEPNDLDERNLIEEGSHYDVYDFGGKSSVKINGKTVSVKDAFANKAITRADIISQLIYDSLQGKNYDLAYSDGGSHLYAYENFNITVTNSLSASKQTIFFSRSNLEINAYEELYPYDNSVRYDEETGDAILGDFGGYDKKAPKSSDNIMFDFTAAKAKKVETIFNDSKYKILTFGGSLEVSLDGINYDLKNIINKNVSTSQLLHKLENDANMGCCSSYYYTSDGNYIKYGYDNITVLVSNKLTTKEPEIIFTLSENDDSNIVSTYLLSKKATYTGSDYNEGLGINCKLEDKLNDTLWVVSIKTLDDEEIEKYVNKEVKSYSLFGEISDEDIERYRKNMEEYSTTYYLIDLSNVSKVDKNVSAGDTISLVYSGDSKDGYSTAKFTNDYNEDTTPVTYSPYELGKRGYLVDKVLSPNKCYLISDIYEDDDTSENEETDELSKYIKATRRSNIMFIKSNDIIEDNALDEGSKFKVDARSASLGSRQYDYLDGVISVEKAK